jgi:crotonobetainyl-CoA:carnitine CoA-transferase CaiB-like acyl-CoA transferase
LDDNSIARKEKTMVTQPLKGVKVVDLTYYVAGPGTAKILANWGAEVIKIEPPAGEPGRGTSILLGMPASDDINPYFTIFNCNKRAVALDLKNKDGLQILHKLLAEANVFVTSFRPGALQRLGLDYEAMSRKHPHIVWASINGFGDYGPDKDKAGFDTVAFWARSGAMMDLPEKDTSPINPTLAFGDATTSCSLSGGICAGLYNQQKTGKGCKVIVSLLSQAIWNLSPVVAAAQFGAEFPKSRLCPASPQINSYQTKDGKWTFVSVLDYERMRPGLFRVLEREDLMNDKRFESSEAAADNSAALVKIISESIKKFTREEFIARLDAEDIANEKIQRTADVLNDPQALQNNYVVEYTHRNGQITKHSMPPVKFGNIDVVMQHPETPLVGEHTAQVLKEHGFNDAQIEAFAKSGAIYCRR